MTGKPNRSASSITRIAFAYRSEEHTSELQSQSNLVCRLLLEKKKSIHTAAATLSIAASPPTRPSWVAKRLRATRTLQLTKTTHREATLLVVHNYTHEACATGR